MVMKINVLKCAPGPNYALAQGLQWEFCM